ncbi:MAG: hypothetical protein IJV31_11230 [Clostridia bacterium]|nr:hypothetical protein [Clostridia bacterium]
MANEKAKANAKAKAKVFRDKMKSGLTKQVPANAHISVSKTNFENNSKLKGLSTELLEQDFSEPYLFVFSAFAYILKNQWRDSVEFHIETRRKSKDSINSKIEKQQLEVEDGKRNSVSLKDILASSIIIDFVADERNTSKIRKIGDSKEVLYEMQRRTENIDLLANIVKYFNKQLEIGSFFSIYDNEKTSNKNVEALEEAFNGDFYNTVLKYRDKKELENMPIIDLDRQILGILEKEKGRYVNQLKIFTERNSIERKNKIEIKIEIFNRVIDKIKNKITEQDMKQDAEEEYYKYMLILLNSLKNVEYEKCSVREAKDRKNGEQKESPEYTKIKNAFEENFEIFLAKNLEENEFFDGDVSLEDLKALERWCAKLNAQMSDKLQQEILKNAISRLYLLIPGKMNAFLMDELDSKIFENGYVADHSNLLIQFGENIMDSEVQLKTFFRKKVASIGSASHGGNGNRKNGRQEKERDWNILPQYSEDDPNKIVISGHTYSLDELKRVTAEQCEDDNLKQQYKEWKEKLNEILPYYATIEIENNNKTKKPIVVCKIHGIIENLEKYFGETNVRNKRKLLEDAIRIIRENKLLNNYERSIYLSEEGYMKYVEKLKNDTERN